MPRDDPPATGRRVLRLTRRALELYSRGLVGRALDAAHELARGAHRYARDGGAALPLRMLALDLEALAASARCTAESVVDPSLKTAWMFRATALEQAADLAARALALGRLPSPRR